MRPVPQIKILKTLTIIVASLVLTLSLHACMGGKSFSIKSVPVALPVSSTTSASSLPGVTSQASTLKQIIATGKVKIAVPDDFSPFGAVGPDMQPQGYDIDVAKRLAKALKVELEMVPVTGNYRVPYLQTERVDMIISSLGANPERAKTIAFSIPYAPFFSGVYGGSNIKVSSLQDLKNHTIGVAQGSLEDLQLSKLPPRGAEIKRFAGNSLTTSALLSGQVELIATGNTVAAKIIKDNPGQKIEKKFILKNSPCHIGMRRGDSELVQWVNNFIANERQKGELDKLSQKWFKEPLRDLPTS